MSSFIFLMVNPFLLMLPTNPGELGLYMKYFRDLKKRERKSMTEIESLERSIEKEKKAAEKRRE